MNDKEVLEFIACYHTENGFSPSYSEIADYFDTVKSAVHTRMKSLREAGRLTLVKPPRCPIVLDKRNGDK